MTLHKQYIMLHIPYITLHLQHITLHLQHITLHIPYITLHLQHITLHMRYMMLHIPYLTLYIRYLILHIPYITLHLPHITAHLPHITFLSIVVKWKAEETFGRKRGVVWKPRHNRGKERAKGGVRRRSILWAGELSTIFGRVQVERQERKGCAYVEATSCRFLSSSLKSGL
jgi:hypothetical protein